MNAGAEAVAVSGRRREPSLAGPVEDGFGTVRAVGSQCAQGVHARHRELRRVHPVLAAVAHAIATTLGSGGGKGSRSVASYDED